MTLIAQKEVEVRESSRSVSTNLDVRDGDKLLFEATGAIWAGVWFTGTNGPGGWNNITYDPKFPLTGAHPYSLLARLGGRYIELGSGLEYDYLPGNGLISRLSLRTNDDVPGNGSGAFHCTVRQYGTRP